MNAKRLTRSRNDMIAGVCAGIAEFVGWDVTLVRVLWVLGTLLSVGTGILVYFVLALVMPREDAPGGHP